MSRVLMFLAALALCGAAQAGGNAEAGKQKAAQVCATCHGPAGKTPAAPENPILAGQHPDYLAKALQDYKSGKRKNAVMNALASTLSRQDIEDVAAWFSSQSSDLHSQR
jgi:cytochrome c553